MEARSPSRDLIQRIAERSVVPRRAVHYGEDMRTLLAGSLSASLGGVVLVVLYNSMVGRPMGDWNVREIHGALFMSSVAASVAIVGIILGGVGLRIGWKPGRRISIVSALGVVSCYVAVLISLIIVLYRESVR